MNEINTSIRFCDYFTSFPFTKSCKRIVVSDFFFTRWELYGFLNALKRLSEFPHLESEMLTNSLTTQTDTQERSISSFSDYLSESIHFWIRKVIDIAWSTTEDENIFIGMNSIHFGVSYVLRILYFYTRTERFYHDTEYIGEIILKIDNGYFFSDKFGRGIELVLFSEVESREKFISRELHCSFMSLFLHRMKYGGTLLKISRKNRDVSSCFISGFICFALRLRSLCDSCTGCDGCSFFGKIQMHPTNSNSTVEVSVISIDTEDTTIVCTSDILYPSDDFCCFVYRTSSERRRIQRPAKCINSVGSGDDFSCDDIFGMYNRSCLA